MMGMFELLTQIVFYIYFFKKLIFNQITIENNFSYLRINLQINGHIQIKRAHQLVNSLEMIYFHIIINKKTVNIHTYFSGLGIVSSIQMEGSYLFLFDTRQVDVPEFYC